MFVRQEYRDWLLGLIAAMVVLAVGAVATGSIHLALAEESKMHATRPPSPVDRSKQEGAEDCSATLRCRCDTVC